MLLLDESMAGLTHTEVDESLKMISGIRTEYGLTIILVHQPIGPVLVLQMIVLAIFWS